MTKQFHTFLSVSRLVTVLGAAAGPASKASRDSTAMLERGARQTSALLGTWRGLSGSKKNEGLSGAAVFY